MLRALIWALVPVLLLASCKVRSSPEAAVREFLSAVQNGDAASARELLVSAENGSPNIAFERGALIKGWSVGTALVEGERARVPVATTPPRNLQLVVVMEDGQWHISMMETLRGMLAGSGRQAPPPAAAAGPAGQPASPR
jgi:hypothetical protein